MGRGGIAALSSGADRRRTNPRPELDHRDEAVSAGPVPALRTVPRRRPEGGERAVVAARERHRYARRIVAERMLDRRGDALEAVDLAPRQPPFSELTLKPRDGI